MIYLNVNWGQKDINHVLKVWSQLCSKKNHTGKETKTWGLMCQDVSSASLWVAGLRVIIILFFSFLNIFPNIPEWGYIRKQQYA